MFHQKQLVKLRFNITGSSWNFYLAAYFWVVYETTTTGYNIFNPSSVTLNQIIYVGVIVGTMLITYFSVRVISIRANVNQALAAFQDHMRDVTRYMRQEKLSMQLQKEVYEYYTYSWDKMGGVDYRSVIKLCDQITLRTEAILHIYGETFSKCPVLQKDHALLRLVGRSVHSVYLVRGTRLIERDDVIAEMYIVDYGLIEVRDPEEDFSVGALTRGSIFGNLEEVTTLRILNAFVARTNVHLLMLNTDKFYRITRDFPSVKMQLDLLRPKKQNFIVGVEGFEPGLAMLNKKPVEIDLKLGILHLLPQKGFAKHFGSHSKVMHIYLIIISSMVCYLDIYNATFKNNSYVMIFLLYVLDVCFYLKIIIKCVLPTTYKDKEARHFMYLTRKMYFIHGLKYDIISCVPIELFCYFVSVNKRWSVFAFLRLNRVLRVTTIKECLARYHENLHINLVCSTLASVTIWFTIFIHTASCIWYYLGEIADENQPNSSWRYTDEGVPQCRDEYFCSLYYVLTTFLHDGIGDILPKVHIEIVFSCLLQIISTLLYMIYVGEFSNIIQYQSFRSFNYYRKYVELQEFLKCNRVAKNLVALVNKYALHLWRESRGMQTPRFLEKAPQCLRTKIMCAAYLRHLLAHPVFRNCEPAFLRQLVRYFKLYTYNSGVYVVKESEITDAMYVIHEGLVEKIAEDLEETINVFRASDYFGTGLYRDTPYNFSYRTKGNAKVLTLCLHDWEYLLTHFPKSKAYIFEEYSKTSFDDDDKFPDKDRKRVQVTKQPGHLHETTLKIGSNRRKLRKKSKSNLSPVLQAKSETLTKQLGQNSQSLTELLPAKALSNMGNKSSLLDVDQMSKLFPMNSGRDISEDLTPSPQSEKRQLESEQTFQTKSNLTVEKEKAKIPEFLSDFESSLETLTEVAVSYQETYTTIGLSRPDDQDKAPEHVQMQIDKHIDDDETKTTDKQPTESSVDEQKQLEEESTKEEKPSDDGENSKK